MYEGREALLELGKNRAGGLHNVESTKTAFLTTIQLQLPIMNRGAMGEKNRCVPSLLTSSNLILTILNKVPPMTSLSG